MVLMVVVLMMLAYFVVESNTQDRLPTNGVFFSFMRYDARKHITHRLLGIICNITYDLMYC